MSYTALTNMWSVWYQWKSKFISGSVWQRIILIHVIKFAVYVNKMND